MPPAYGEKGGTQYQRGDLRFEETSDYQASDGKLSDRSVANTFPDNRGRLRSAGGFLDSALLHSK